MIYDSAAIYMAGYLVDSENSFLRMEILNKWAKLVILVKKEKLFKISDFISLDLFSILLGFGGEKVGSIQFSYMISLLSTEGDTKFCSLRR